MSETEENKTIPEEVSVPEEETNKKEDEETTTEKSPTEDDDKSNNDDDNDDDDLFDSDSGSDSDSGTEKKRRLNKIVDDDDDDEEEDNKEDDDKTKDDDFDPFALGNEISKDLGYNSKKKDADDFIEEDMKPKKKRRKSEKTPRKKRSKGELKEDEYDESGESISTETGSSSKSKKDRDAMIEEKAKRIISVMNEAFDEDVACVKAHKIPFNMINKMREVQEVLSNSRYYKALENNGVFFSLAYWLKPLKGSLPLAETRGKIINLSLEIVKAADIVDNSFEAFKDSELTARIYYLYKKDTNPENRKLAKKFIDYVSVAIINRN